MNKAKLIISRCIERGVILKFSKSWLGFKECSFFGYKCKHNSFYLSDDRKQAVADMVMPTTQKGMRRFLGTANFFHRFMPNFSQLTAQLTEMTKNTFN